MYRRLLIAAAAITLILSSLSFAQIDKIAIFNEQVSWTDAATATAATDFIIANVKVANEIKVYSDATIKAFAEANTADGDLDIIITFGWFPTNLYPPGNAEVDGSAAENFLQGGDMFLNTADYIFYVSNPNNDAGGLQNMTNTALDMWTDGTVCKPTADGSALTPSLPATYNAPRCFRADQFDAEPDWDVEKIFGSDGANNLDPVIIRNNKNGGRVGIAFQVGDATPRGEVISEMIKNYIAENTAAVNSIEKATTTWGAMKR